MFPRVLWAKIAGRPVALCDSGDVDGIASAALFKRRYPNGVVILASPTDMRKLWVKLTRWDFVADLPCPGRVRIRADHHKTNKPCAELEYYDPNAPAAAVMAARALAFEEDPVARELVEAAVQTDTANVIDERIKLLDLAVRYASVEERLKAVEILAVKGLAALQEESLRAMAARGLEREKTVGRIVEAIPIDEKLFIYSPIKLGISYRALVIELERRGAKFVNILVRRGWRTYRLYCGAHRDSQYDCTEIAQPLGGGGHKYASGAVVKAPLFDSKTPLNKLIDMLKPQVIYSLGSCSEIPHCVEIKW